MTERTARQQGLSFTGVYERSYNRDVAKTRAAEIRKEFKCRAVLVEANCGGVSVYADDLYRIRYNAKTMQAKLDAVEARKAKAEMEYNKAIQLILHDQLTTQRWFDENKAALNY